jgi:hypothetical protein
MIIKAFSGSLGQGARASRDISTPRTIPGFTNLTSITAGRWHTLLWHLLSVLKDYGARSSVKVYTRVVRERSQSEVMHYFSLHDLATSLRKPGNMSIALAGSHNDFFFSERKLKVPGLLVSSFFAEWVAGFNAYHREEAASDSDHSRP